MPLQLIRPQRQNYLSVLKRCIFKNYIGRNYIEVGSYTEIYFPKNNVRYIAVNDNFDSMYTDGNELAPFKNLFN